MSRTRNSKPKQCRHTTPCTPHKSHTKLILHPHAHRFCMATAARFTLCLLLLIWGLPFLCAVENEAISPDGVNSVTPIRQRAIEDNSNLDIDEDDLPCSVCSSVNRDDENGLLLCDGHNACNVATHYWVRNTPSHTHTHLHTHTHTLAHTHTYTHTHPHTHTFTHTHSHTRTHAHIHAHTFTHKQTHTPVL